MEKTIQCWQCGGEINASEVFCRTCKTIQPPSQIDHFTRLGLPKSFEIGDKNLDVAYFALQRALHPDRYLGKSPQKQKYSMGHTVDLNDAYETLKSPLKRAEYLLKLDGVIVNQDNSYSVKPSQELLMESLEVREELDEASDSDQIRALAIKANDDRMACIDSIKDLLVQGNLQDAAQNIIKLRYLEKLLEEIRGKNTQ
jgi:molecular chaperone HscB